MNRKLFENRQLSRRQAELIANSQKDLGGVSKKYLIIALGGIKDAKNYDELVNARIEAYNRLDELSQLIVDLCLRSDIEGSYDNFDYTINQLSKVKDVLLHLRLD